MKKSSIIGLVVIAIAVAIIISTAGDASSYVTFDEAYAMATNGKAESIHVVGELKKAPNGQVVGVQPSEDMLSVQFILVDDNQKEQTRLPQSAHAFRSAQVGQSSGYWRL